MLDDGGHQLQAQKTLNPIAPVPREPIGKSASFRERLLDVAALAASIYPRRRWVVIVIGACAGLLLYRSAEHISHVYGPPSRYGPAVDYVVPISGSQRPVDDNFELDIEVGLDGCHNPVRVIASANGPGLGVRNWLRSPALVSFGIEDPSVRNLRTFISNGFATIREKRKFFDADFRGSQRILEVRDNPLETASSEFGPGMRGVSAHAPAFGSARAYPVIYWSFTVDWLHPRSYGTCYLALPLVIGPGPGAPLVQLPRPPQGRYAGISVASVELTNWDFSEGPEGLRLTPLHVLVGDSSPAPAQPEYPGWTCAARGGNQSACNGGYVALATSNATGTTNTALFLRLLCLVS